VEELKAVTEEISEGQKRKEETRQEIEEIKPECRKLKEEIMIISKQIMIISKQIDCNQIKANLMLSILKAREDKNFAQAAQLTQLLRFVD